CLHPPTGRVYISRHVLFDETRFPYSDSYRNLLTTGNTPLLQAWSSGDKLPAVQTIQDESVEEVTVQGSQQENESATIASEAGLNQVSETAQNSPQQSDQSNNSASESQQNVQAEPIGNTHGMVTRAKQRIHKPNPRYAMHTVKGLLEEPKTVKEALKHPGWTAAMGEEIDTCHVTKTWSLQEQSVMLLLMYVDDMVLTGNDSSLISKLLSKLNEKFMMKDMGPLKYFLGIQAQFTPTNIFTKPLPQASFLSLRFKLGVDYPPTSSLRGSVKASRPAQTMQAQEEPKLQSKAPTVTKKKTSSHCDRGKSTTTTPHQIQLNNRFASLSDLASSDSSS
ncbi:unnamed protein product, partial [Arabidopsis halleri]